MITDDALNVNPTTSAWPIESFVAANLLIFGEPDIQFHIEGEHAVFVPAHVVVVANASPMLERSCFGSGDYMSASRVIQVPPCSVAVFHIFYRHLYAAFDPKKHITGCPNAAIGMTLQNAASVLLLADYYNVRPLEQQCVALLRHELGPENVCAVFDVLYVLETNAVRLRCLDLILKQASVLLDDILRMRSPVALRAILGSDQLNLRGCESALFFAMYEWSTRQLGEDVRLPQEASLRRALLQREHRLQFVRFAAMSAEEFGRCVKRAGAGFFSDAEIATTMKTIAFGDREAADAAAMAEASATEPSDSLVFSCVPRQRVKNAPVFSSDYWKMQDDFYAHDYDSDEMDALMYAYAEEYYESESLRRAILY